MYPGQIITLATLLLAACIFVGSIVLATHISANDTLFATWQSAGWAKGVGPNDRSFFAFVVVFLGLGFAVGLVQAQQSCVAWLARRELRRAHQMYLEVEMALGTEAANRFMEYKAERMQAEVRGAPNPFGLFG